MRGPRTLRSALAVLTLAFAAGASALSLGPAHAQRAGPVVERNAPQPKEATPPENPTTLEEQQEFAAIYQLRLAGKFAEALPRALALAEQLKRRLGESVDYATVLNQIGVMQIGAGRTAEAEATLLRVLTVQERLLGREHEAVASTLGNLGMVYKAMGRFADANAYLRHALALQEKRYGADDPRLALTLNNLALVLQALGRMTEAETLYKRAADGMRKNKDASAADLAIALQNLGNFYTHVMRLDEAESLIREALAIQEKALGRQHHSYAMTLSNLALIDVARGNFANAAGFFADALAIYESALGPTHPMVPVMLDNIAYVHRTLGRYKDAEQFARRAIAVAEQARGIEHPTNALHLSSLAAIYRATNRLSEAEALFKRALDVIERKLGPDHIDAAAQLSHLVPLYNRAGRYAEAETMMRRAIAIIEKTHGPEHFHLASAYGLLAFSLDKLNRVEEAETHYRRAMEIGDKVLGPQHPFMSYVQRDFGEMLFRLGRAREAEPLLRQTVQNVENALGPSHPDLAGALMLLAQTSLLINPEQSLAAARRAARIDIANLSKVGLANDAANKGTRFEVHIDVLRRTKADGLIGREADAESFEAAQWANRTSAAAALSQMAARFGAGNDALAKMIREQQDATRARAAIDKSLVEQLGAPSDKRNITREATLRASLAEIDARIEALEQQIAAASPRFAELINPKPLSIAAARKLVGADEALLFFHISENRGYVWAISRERAEWRSLKLPQKLLEQQVGKLRASLEIDKATNEYRPFDVATAHDLYTRLLEPVQDVIGGKRNLVVVPTGPLASLPFHLLLTDRAAVTGTQQTYRGLPWLARRHAVTVLPSVRSLADLRAVVARAPAPKAYVGFGDPAFVPQQVAAVGRMRFASAVRSSGLRTLRSIDLKRLGRSLTPLPESAREIRAVGRALRAAPNDIHVGSDANERVVKSLRLADYRVLHFATHGLLADETGKFNVRAEPALALSLPQVATELDNGLLTASEVAALQLNADVVILSACNTAAGDMPGAEPLSGLARSFFYAGARTLLVSHWPVQSEAAVTLVTQALQAIEREPALAPAEALRRAMIALMDGGAEADNHPAVWAPFVVVGLSSGNVPGR